MRTEALVPDVAGRSPGQESTPKPTEQCRRCRWSDHGARSREYIACFWKDQSIGAVPAQERQGSLKICITIASGAADSVADPGCFPGYEVPRHEHPVRYQSATGELITNVGEQSIALLTNDCTFRGMPFQATARVRKPLASVKSIVDACHPVKFAPDELGGSCIRSLETLDESGLREDDGNYPPGRRNRRRVKQALIVVRTIV